VFVSHILTSASVLTISVLLASGHSVIAQTRLDEARVQAILDRSIVIDLHSDTTHLILNEGYDLAERHDYGQVDIPRMREGGMTAMFFATNPSSRRLTPLESIKRGLEEVAAIRREVARHPSQLVLATTAEEIVAAKAENKMAILMSIEGGHVIDSSLAVLRAFYDLGIRYMTLTHFTHTPWADSSGEPPRSNGLTEEGKEIVSEMNRLGMMVDISHVSDETFYDVLETSAAPVIASHSSCREFSSHPRNMSDDMLRALARNGGVVHINYANIYLDEEHRVAANKFNTSDEWLDLRSQRQAIVERYPDDPKRRGAARRKLNAERLSRLGRVSLSRLLDHFEHAARVAGVDHVGLGSDFDGVSDQLPEGMEDVSKTPNLVRGLLERGFSEGDIEKILGQNTLRVMREVERVSRENG